jgi:hypothetical protein
MVSSKKYLTTYVGVTSKRMQELVKLYELKRKSQDKDQRLNIIGKSSLLSWPERKKGSVSLRHHVTKLFISSDLLLKYCSEIEKDLLAMNKGGLNLTVQIEALVDFIRRLTVTSGALEQSLLAQYKALEENNEDQYRIACRNEDSLIKDMSEFARLTEARIRSIPFQIDRYFLTVRDKRTDIMGSIARVQVVATFAILASAMLLGIMTGNGGMIPKAAGIAAGSIGLDLGLKYIPTKEEGLVRDLIKKWA